MKEEDVIKAKNAFEEFWSVEVPKWVKVFAALEKKSVEQGFIMGYLRAKGYDNKELIKAL